MKNYNFPAKTLYRQRREAVIDQFGVGNRYTRRVAYLDTGQALDTIAYLGRGYRPENLWAINRNKQSVANISITLKRLGLPLVNTVVGEFEDAMATKVPVVDVIDFDGMSNLNEASIASLSRVIRSRPECRTVGITLTGSRERFDDLLGKTVFHCGVGSCTNRIEHDDEPPVLTSFNTRSLASHYRRIKSAVYHTMLSRCETNSCCTEQITCPFEFCDMCSCRFHIQDLKWDVYVSTTGQSMIWAVYKIAPHVDNTTMSEVLRSLTTRMRKHRLFPHCLGEYECFVPDVPLTNLVTGEYVCDECHKAFDDAINEYGYSMILQ